MLNRVGRRMVSGKGGKVEWQYSENIAKQKDSRGEIWQIKQIIQGKYARYADSVGYPAIFTLGPIYPIRLSIHWFYLSIYPFPLTVYLLYFPGPSIYPSSLSVYLLGILYLIIVWGVQIDRQGKLADSIAKLSPIRRQYAVSFYLDGQYRGNRVYRHPVYRKQEIKQTKDCPKIFFKI